MLKRFLLLFIILISLSGCAKVDLPIKKDITETTISAKQDTFLDFEEDGYNYQFLSDNEKRCYYQILTAIQNVETDVPIEGRLIKSDDVEKILKLIKFDHPEIFWLDKATLYSEPTTKFAIKLTIYYNELSSNKDDIMVQIKSIAEEIKYATSELTYFEKEKYIHDYLINTCTYQQNEFDQTIYSALILNKTVCAGYAKAFQYLCSECGIETLYVVGDLCNKESTEGHAWNLVKLQGEYYAVDVTSDDFESVNLCAPIYKYFNFNEDDFKEIFKRYDICLDLPESNGTRYTVQSYFNTSPELYSTINVFGEKDIISSLNEYKNYFLSKAKLHRIGTYKMEYIVTSKELLNDISDWLDNGKYIKSLLSFFCRDEITFKYKLSILSVAKPIFYVEQEISFLD